MGDIMADLNGAGGAKEFVIDLSTDTTIENFGAFGTSGKPADAAELDTIQLDIFAANMLLEQVGTSVVASVADDPARTGKRHAREHDDRAARQHCRRRQFPLRRPVKGDGQCRCLERRRERPQGLSSEHRDLSQRPRQQREGFDEGNDVINGMAGNDTLNGLAHNDLLRGGEGDDTLIGGLGNDRLFGGDGNDNLAGGRGDDLLDGGDGDDAMAGGRGNDIYVVDSLGDTIVEDRASSRGGGWADEVRSSISFSLSPYARIENLTLTGGDIDGSGNSRANVITGSGGFNNLKGAGGDDVLVGGGGVDEYHGDTGNDVIVLGEGDDSTSGEMATPRWWMAAADSIP
jgi:hypothetical protein